LKVKHWDAVSGGSDVITGFEEADLDAQNLGLEISRRLLAIESFRFRWQSYVKTVTRLRNKMAEPDELSGKDLGQLEADLASCHDDLAAAFAGMQVTRMTGLGEVSPNG
jgi:hypothetical protein